MPEDNYTQSKLLEKQVEPLFKATLPGGLGNIFSGFLVYLLLIDTTHRENALWLCLSIAIISIVRIFVSNHYLYKKKFSVNSYLFTHVAMTLVIGITWGMFEFMLRNPDDGSLRSIVYLIFFGLLAGSITTLSTYKKAFLAYVIPQAIAIFSVFILLDTTINYYMAFGFFIFMSFMISTSFSINKSHKKEIELTLNNKQLITDLNEEVAIREKVQVELEKHKYVLEETVKDRTSELEDINVSLEKVIEKKELAEESLQYLAYHDELTGLPNRNLLVDRVGQSIKTSSRENQKMAILFLDLDRFKNINDSLGHNVGDMLLQEVSSRLFDTLRDRDTISRNGGDEFVIVLERLENTSEAIYVAKKIINCLTETFEIQSHKIHLGASIGISIYPNDGDSPLILLRNADTAMYRAKQAGGNQLHFYDESMSSQLRDRLELESELHNALQNNEFYLAYQPQVSCITGRLVGFEALLRWNNKRYGEIGPARFVPLLEETGLIYAVGDWIVTQVVDFIRMHNIKDIKFSINLSALQCNSLGFVDYVNNKIIDAEINPALIEFEITETLLIKDFDKTEVFLDKIHSIGCTIALDDFGTGYTSMSYLARLPVDVIKIDRSLVRNIDVNNSLRSIVNAIVTMSQGLGVKNVFEGVEAEAELSAIKKMNGDIIQGFLFSKPLKAIDAVKWLSASKVVN
jgi:diguanylate cyclase (GGDEF)-like protein